MESESSIVAQASQRRLERFREHPWPESAWPFLAAELAEELLRASLEEMTGAERRKYNQLARMLQDEAGKAFTSSLADRVYRSEEPPRILEQVRELIKRFGIPNYLPSPQRGMLGALRSLGGMVPGLTTAAMKAMIRRETSDVILRGELAPLNEHLERRSEEDLRMNCNRLGEAILSHAEAKSRFDIYLKDLNNPLIDYVSVKISSVCAQISLLAWDDTFERICEHLRILYRAAMENPVTEDGATRAKFVNLDMEEYRDLELTYRVFRHVLSDPEFHKLSAGIVLQAYIPDSFPIQQELTQWAVERYEQGGAPIKIRIVKGANLAMEQIEASRHDWEQAPYATKAEVDANYKRMVGYGAQPKHACAVHIGVASHNLFDIAYAMVLQSNHGIGSWFEFEMLEGMAEHQRRAVQALTKSVLLYAPLATDSDFRSAIAYLVRRLDENTAEGNFLRHLFDLHPESPAWREQKRLFLEACAQKEKVASGPRRTQDRRLPVPELGPDNNRFHNEADTDFTLPANREWVDAHRSAFLSEELKDIPVAVGADFVREGLELCDGFDPSRPGVVPYRYRVADSAHAERVLSIAQAALSNWSRSSIAERSSLLRKSAQEFRRARGRLLAVMTLDGGKAAWEADAELSEAVDFAEYYRRGLDAFVNIPGIELAARGVTVITPPWNFPLAIAAGGIMAALMGGNTVILKPPAETVLSAWEMVNCLWRAGVPRDVLQFIPCHDEPVGTQLIQDARVKVVILTGGTSTAELFLKWRPELSLFAEAGGKNALIVTSVADLDLAIKDAVQSAFGHAGQKCSAASLLVCEKEVYDHPDFPRRLREAAASLPVGSAWDHKSIVTPVIHPPEGALKKAQSGNDEGESWLLEPKADPDNPRIWSPGIKWGVKKGSFYHESECFGPLLGVMRAENLKHAIELVNSTEYGLTSGIHSLNESEQLYWAEHIQAGNLYVNRGTTGAIVQRQPFGGWKRSNFGPGAKAGGPNYVLQMCTITETSAPRALGEARSPLVKQLIEAAKSALAEEGELVQASLQSYEEAWQSHFGKGHDPSGIRGQMNIFRYRPTQILLRFAHDARVVDLLRALGALQICGCDYRLSVAPQAKEKVHPLLSGPFKCEVSYEEDEAFYEAMHKCGRIRLLGTPTAEMYRAAQKADRHLAAAAVLSHGRLELINYLREQSLSVETHRYGNLSPNNPWDRYLESNETL